VSLADRMPPLPADQMTPAQRVAAQEIVAGPRGNLYGPFVPALRSPEFLRRLQRLGEYLRYEVALPPRLREMAIILTAREWTQDFEWDVHAPLALKVGLASSIVDAIREGRRPTEMGREETVLYDFFVELQRSRTVSDATYASAVSAFGEQGVIDLVGAIGYYSTLAMIMNVARTPLPEGKSADLPALPR
jgi:4-carboxymuconolactone decarboxylase